MEVNGKGLFSREIYDRLKIFCISSCVDLKVKFLNSLTINGGAEGYGMLRTLPVCGDALLGTFVIHDNLVFVDIKRDIVAVFALKP